MGKKSAENVTMRVRVGEMELEVTGPSDFVEKKIKEFIESHRSVQSAPSVVAGGSRDAQTSLPSGGPKGTSLVQLFKKIFPKSDVERILAAGYYLEKYKQEQNFTTADIVAVIRSSRTPPPTNPSDVIAKNIMKGMMMPSGDKEGKRAYVLTTDGVEAIESLLRAS